MVKTTIELTEDQIARLEKLAGREGRSIEDVVRESVDVYIARQEAGNREELKRRFLSVAGRFHSGIPDLAVEHDRYLADALETEAVEQERFSSTHRR